MSNLVKVMSAAAPKIKSQLLTVCCSLRVLLTVYIMPFGYCLLLTSYLVLTDMFYYSNRFKIVLLLCLALILGVGRKHIASNTATPTDSSVTPSPSATGTQVVPSPTATGAQVTSSPTATATQVLSTGGEYSLYLPMISR